MKTSFEKEKKLNDALTRLKNFHVETDNSKSNFEILEKQKNQLEIEKKELQSKFDLIEEENQNLKQNLEKFKLNEVEGQRKEAEFSEKIDELNQETDSLMNEIEKWQM